MTYKGLPLLVEAMERLRDGGILATLGIYGEGDLGALRSRIAALGATVVDRWIEHGEIGGILAQHDVVVLPYIEASQSGVTPAAHGAGLPVIVTPVGGLADQVRHGVDGLVTATSTAPAIADAIAALATDRALEKRLRAGAAETRSFDVPAFANRLRELALGAPDPR
ncbi:MAG: glycosyltransferase family 4 protein [Bauldia sp.]